MFASWSWVDGLPLVVLPLERITHSKRAAGTKDLAVLPALEAALAVERGQDSRRGRKLTWIAGGETKQKFCVG